MHFSPFFYPFSIIFIPQPVIWQYFCPNPQNNIHPCKLDVQWSCLNRLDVQWSYLNKLDVQWSYLNKLDVQWSYLNKLDVQWSYLNKLDVQWSYLNKLDVQWSYFNKLDIQCWSGTLSLFLRKTLCLYIIIFNQADLTSL